MSKTEKSSNKRIYIVKNRGTNEIRMVETVSAASARNHVSRDAYDVHIPTVAEAIDLSKRGITVEQAGESPQLDAFPDDTAKAIVLDDQPKAAIVESAPADATDQAVESFTSLDDTTPSASEAGLSEPKNKRNLANRLAAAVGLSP